MFWTWRAVESAAMSPRGATQRRGTASATCVKCGGFHKGRDFDPTPTTRRTTKVAPMLKVFDARQLKHAPAMEFHNGGWTDHAETLSRSRKIVEAVGGVAPARDFGTAPIARVHAADYLDFLATAHDGWVEAGRSGDAIGSAWPIVDRRPLNLRRIDALLGRYSFDASTPITAGTWESAYWSAQTALTALQPLLDGNEQTSFALCRPPGHHAGEDYCGGYCYINNAAVAAQAAIDSGRDRVAVLDIDYHHGNGTQAIFYDRDDVLFASVHADPAVDYPFFWGYADERGTGRGAGATMNFPLPRGTAITAYLDAIDEALAAIRKFGPRMLILSFGADTFDADPICHFALRTDDYPHLAARIAALDVPTLIVMEGGYSIDSLGENVAAFLQGFQPV